MSPLHRAACSLLERYLKVIKRIHPNTSADDPCGIQAIEKICQDVLSDPMKYHVDRVCADLGFVQGVLGVRGHIDMKMEYHRRTTLFHEAYRELGLVPPASELSL